MPGRPDYPFRPSSPAPCHRDRDARGRCAPRGSQNACRHPAHTSASQTPPCTNKASRPAQDTAHVSHSRNPSAFALCAIPPAHLRRRRHLCPSVSKCSAARRHTTNRRTKDSPPETSSCPQTPAPYQTSRPRPYLPVVRLYEVSFEAVPRVCHSSLTNPSHTTALAHRMIRKSAAQPIPVQPPVRPQTRRGRGTFDSKL